MKFRDLPLLTAVLFLSQIANAGFHLEPGIGYNRGHYQTDKSQGLGLMFKTGFDFSHTFIVADVGYHDLQLGSTPNSNLTDVSISLGGDFRSWRCWYSHIVSASLSTGIDTAKVNRTGTGYKLGLSGQVSAGAYVNLEARFIDLQKSTTATGTESTITEFMDAAFISVSWPF